MKTTTLLILLSSVLGGLFYNVIDDFIANKAQFLPIVLVVFLDAIFATLSHLKSGDFKTSKSLIFVGKIASFGAALYVIIKVEEGYDYVDWLSEAIMVPILMGQILSMFKHWYSLGLISGPLLENLLNNVDRHKTGLVDQTTEEENNELQN